MTRGPMTTTCTHRAGPCVDPTMAGTRCRETATGVNSQGEPRCDRHTTKETQMSTGTPIFDTVGALQAFLAEFPQDTPLTVMYDGTGRVSGVRSYEDDVLYCVALFPASEAWLAGNNLASINPLTSP